MSLQDGPPDAEAVLRQLKGFQRDTAEYAFQRLYLDDDSTHRFLVADEVGLGKTLVARGIVAKTIEHLWDQVDRIDIVYICSNSNIARQNISRLSLPGCPAFEHASRVTLLPIELESLASNKVNLVSFTPGTSFRLSGGGGKYYERILLYWLLHEMWDFGQSSAPKNIFQGGAGKKRFRRLLKAFPRDCHLDATLAERFRRAVEAQVDSERDAGKPDLRSRFLDLCDLFKYARKNVPREEKRIRNRFIGDLRTLLARTCLQALEPDLVILDEFQRFRDLLDGDDPAAELASDLFSYADDTTAVRTLLLSATPYKMYTLAHELGEENHYEDFLRTVHFLNGSRQDENRLPPLLGRYRQELYGLGEGSSEGLEEAKNAVEAELRRVMSRTERVRASDAGDGMLREVPSRSVRLEDRDVDRYIGFQRVARELGHPDVIEYWKSAPYLLNFMDGYKLKEALLEHAEDGASGVAQALSAEMQALLDWREVEDYAEIDPANARLRGFLDDILANGAWQTLWVPPTAPYYRLEEPFRSLSDADFTKRLVFSAWTVVPRVVATLTSYEAERRIFRRFEEAPKNTPTARERRTPLLMFTFSDDRLTGLPVLGLLYPSPSFAALGDTLTARQEIGSAEPSLEEVVDVVKRRLRPLLDLLTRHAPHEGAEDEAWYWAAPILADLENPDEAALDWWDRPDLPSKWSGIEEGSEAASARWKDHVDEAVQLVRGETSLGRPPRDLLDVAALLAIAGPATAALRSFHRVSGGSARLEDGRVRDAAGRAAWAFRSLFNLPEAMAILRAGRQDTPYWLRVLEYSAAGCLPALLDEYAHLLRDFNGLFDREGPELAEALSEAMAPVVSLRTSTLRLDEIDVANGSVAIRDRRLRSRFAMRFGRERGEKEEDAVREDAVRAAFNSPFWPFALISTSVGQEGLDFHPYCHAVVHWNLPANPVDLEQREGRVHRFKGHAVRKNLAARHKADALRNPGDPWERIFGLGAAPTNGQDRGLSPFWIYPLEGGAYVERHVPNLPLSRDSAHLAALRRSLAVYRMVFGQPRQDDLMAYLLERVSLEQLEERRQLLQVDLSPPVFDTHDV